MSKLPKAPLVEVVFELKWDIKMKSDLDDFQYLYGDLYANLKDEFPNRERLTPLEIPFDALINIPVFRFTKNENKYPLIQIGPGVISINTLNEFYVWEDFRENIHKLLDILKDIYPKFQTLKIIPALIYIDFLLIFKCQNKTIAMKIGCSLPMRRLLWPQHREKFLWELLLSVKIR